MRLVVLMVGLITTLAHADWPADKPIEMIIGFAPGGGQDVMTRTFAPYVERLLPGARIVVINRPGASGEIAYSSVARAAPDGYTLGIGSTPGLIAIPLQRKTQYQLADILPIARIVDDPTALVVRAESPFDSLKSYLDRARGDPGSVSAGYNGVGTNGHIGVLLVEQAAGIRFNGIPYQGTGQSRPALLGGHVDSVYMGLGEFLEAGRDPRSRLRLLGYMAANRVKEAGDVPIFKDAGLELVASSERGIFAPRALQASIAARIAQAIERAVADPGFVEAAKRQALVLSYLPGAEWARQMERLTPRLAELVKKMEK
jgi:tripartite-type tricarboxylate transporter receptor subunit TctC